MEESSPASREEYATSPFGPTAIGKNDAVSLDRDALKLLASDTRLDILKTLRQRRMTVSELSSSLALGKSTVFEHLNKLVDGGMVVRHDDPRREWVYYELAPKAKRLFNPVSAKIVLMLSSVIGLALAALVAWSLVSTAAAALHVEVDQGTLLAGEATPLEIVVTAGGETAYPGVHLFAVDTAQYGAFRDGGPLDGRPLGQLDTGSATVPVALAAGDYHVVARTVDGESVSRDGSGRLAVTPARLHVDPSPLLVGADDDRPVRIWLTHEGSVLQGGTLLLEGTAASFPDGRSLRFDDPIETVRMRLADPGEARFSWKSDAPGSFFAPVEGSVRVEVPQVSVAPSFLVRDERTTVTVTLWHDSRGAVAEAPVRLLVDGRWVEGVTDARGVARIPVDVEEASDVAVYVGQHLFQRIPVVRLMYAQTAITSLGLELWAQDLVTGKAIPNAPVLLDGVQIGHTDASGHALVRERGAVLVQAPGYAPYGVAAPGYDPKPVHWVSVKRGSDDGAPVVSVTEFNADAATIRMPLGGTVHVTAVMANPGKRPVVDDAVLRVNGATWSTQDVPLAPFEKRTVEFPLLLREPGLHRISVNDVRVLEVEVVAPSIAHLQAREIQPLRPPWSFADAWK